MKKIKEKMTVVSADGKVTFYLENLAVAFS